MKIAVNITRVIVALLFIVSGLVKANDPLGLSYKMQEFFEVWNASVAPGSFIAKTFHFFNEHSLALSLIMIGLEILAGIALLIGWQRKAILNLLLLLITFFTFLTAYAYLSGKFKNCGCFGDCLPITPLASFLKDVILLAMILFLVWQQKYIEPFFTKRNTNLVLIFSLLFTIAIQWYALNYLPFVDCLPFKKTNNISAQMKMPANAVADSFAMKFIYEKGGKRFEFAPEELPKDLATYKFIDRTQIMVRQGNAEPPIKGFSLVALDGTDFTESILAEPEAVLVFALHLEKPEEWMPSFIKLYGEAKKKNIPVFIASSDAAKGKVIFSAAGYPDVVFLRCDYTAVRTAARTNPTIYLIKKGTVIEKQSAAKIDYIISEL
jgi:uncharacterized membrane protein YphA (DoxX/SURF4 family)